MSDHHDRMLRFCEEMAMIFGIVIAAVLVLRLLQRWRLL